MRAPTGNINKIDLLNKYGLWIENIIEDEPDERPVGFSREVWIIAVFVFLALC